MTTTAAKLRIVIADDHPSIRENLRYLLQAEADLDVVGVARDAVNALRMTLGLNPDVLVVDYDLPDYDGLSVARAVRSGRSATRVVLYTMNTEVCSKAKPSELDACVGKADAPRVLFEAIRGPRPPAPRTRPRVLVVDDDADIRAVIRGALEQDGLEIIESGDGFEALAECERQAPGVVVLDLWLPTMSGQEFVAAYRQLKTGAAPIVVVSAKNDGHQIAKQIGAAAYFAKPFSIAALSDAVRRAYAEPVRPRLGT
jgi:CheY-like chemotaxis protein